MSSHPRPPQAPVAPVPPVAQPPQVGGPAVGPAAVRRPWVAPSARAIELAHEVTAYAGRR